MSDTRIPDGANAVSSPSEYRMSSDGTVPRRRGSWVMVSTDLPTHPKTKRLARQLGIGRFEAVGRLHALWAWTYQYALSGDLTAWRVDDIEGAVDWEGEPGAFYRALLESGFLDRTGDGRVVVHDWRQYSGRRNEEREQTRERVQRHRESKKANPAPATKEVMRYTGVTNAYPSLSPQGVVPDRVPEALVAVPNWLTWRAERDGERVTKVPHDPRTGRRAKTATPSVMTDWQTAASAARQSGDGVGFAPAKDDRVVGIDLDHCRNPETGALDPWAEEIVAVLDSYAEVSPSGTGVHVWVHGEWPYARSRQGPVQVFHNKGFLTVTGKHISGTSEQVEERDHRLKALFDLVFGQPSEPNGAQRKRPPPRSDQEVIERARAAPSGESFHDLFVNGGRDAYPTPSEADLGLASLLSWQSGDAGQIERLVSQSALGDRPKWQQRSDYRARTVRTALGPDA